MVASIGDKITDVPLKVVGEKLRTVPPDHPLISKARKMDICFGVK